MTAAEVLADPQVTEPGLYSDMPEEAYHRDPVPQESLSSSGARKLLPPSCPAIYRYERDHGSPHKRVFDLGHAAHKAVLGIGADVVEVKADNWKTKAAQETRDTAYAAGKVPLLTAEVTQVEAMAAAIRQHPMAAALFDHARGGKPEQSMFWRQEVPVDTADRAQTVWRRARLDWLPNLTKSGRLIIPDYKTAICAEPGAFRRAAFDKGYHQQAAWYIDAVSALGLADDIAFVFVVQEKNPPYPVTVCELDHDALRIGRILNRQALAVFADCQRTGRWPGYSDQVELISPPPWIAREFADTP